ncbi:MAG TPA: RDD family protein [Nitrospirae bacterium]|nr:RDD family protein [Nitrospirota bacterium]
MVLLSDMVSVSILNRAVSRGIDLVIALAVAEALPRAGWFAAVLYILVADGVAGGQSLGKKLLGLRVLGADGEPCRLKDSIMRNLMFGLGILFWTLLHPILGWPLLAAAIGVEFLVLIGSDKGRRLGDELAGTTVVDVMGHEDEAAADGQAEEENTGRDISEGENSSE